MEHKPLTPTGFILIGLFVTLLSYAGYLSYISIDWTVLERLESQKLVLPTPVSAPPIETATPSATLQK